MICVDEFGPLEIRPYPGYHWAKSGEPQRFPATYHRDQGTMTLFAALDLKEDLLLGHGKHRKSWRELLVFLKYLRSRYPEEERLYLVLDNFSPHHRQEIVDWASANNVELVYTPTYASWLNRIECHFAPLRKFALSGVYYADHKAQMRGIRRYIGWRNRHKRDERILKEQAKVRVA